MEFDQNQQSGEVGFDPAPVEGMGPDVPKFHLRVMSRPPCRKEKVRECGAVPMVDGGTEGRWSACHSPTMIEQTCLLARVQPVRPIEDETGGGI